MTKMFSRLIVLLLVIAIVIFALPYSVQADEGDDGLVQLINGYEVTLALAEPPAVGENRIHIRIHDSEETPVSNAHVEVRLAPAADDHGAETSSGHDMPGMDMSEASDGHGDSHGIRLEPAHESGEYSGEIHIESAGEYIVAIHMILDDEAMEVEFPLTVQRDSKYGVLTVFAGLNVTIIAVAAIMKAQRRQNELVKE